jgi:arylsulfatase A-like enzyme
LVDLFEACSFDAIPSVPRHPWSIHRRAQITNRDHLKAYYAMCTGVDRGVARLLDRLESLGVSDNTLVIYTSDQGYCCGHHGLWGKGNASNPRNMYDTSMQVPLIFRHSGKLPAGRTSDALFSAYDFLPTVLDYLGLPVPKGRNLPGRSFVPVLTGAPFEAPDAVFAEYGRARCIRTADFKLVHRCDGGPHELYDLRNDPRERENLADDPAYRERLVALRGRLFQWFDRYAEMGTDPVGQEYLRPEERN